MRSLLLLCAVCACSALSAGPLACGRGVVRAARAAAPSMQFGKKKQLTLAEQGFWEGEWVCADCGWIYEPNPVRPFEKLPPGWKCPQCAGPRRRYVKKAGDMLGKIDDSPLLIGLAVTALLASAAVYFALQV